MSNPDVITGEAPGRYAQALFELAESAKSLKTVEKDMVSLKSMFAKNETLRDMAGNPVFPIEEKVAAMTAVAKKAKLSKLVTQFVGTVTENQRAAEIPAMVSAFEAILASKRGSETAQVTSPKKLTAAQLNKIKSELKKNLGHTVNVETTIDPSLLGGFVVRIGSRLYDSSLKTKLEDLKLALKEA